MKKIIIAALFVGLPLICFSQVDRKIIFPDVPGYKTVKTDLHIHTVFSDGNVWPVIRIEEAIRDNLDLVSMTEHIEYQPHRQDIPHPDRNRSYEIASDFAKSRNILVVSGSEITRSMPPGHNNAVYLTDSNQLLGKDSLEVFQEANSQGAFVFWNHPNWTAQRKDGVARLTEFHEKLIADKLLHGIEVVNELTYSDEALQIALDNNLTIMGTSDIHGLVDWLFEIPQGGHRPLTLVFAKNRTTEDVKEGLFSGRTVVYFRDYLIGREENLIPLLNSSLTVSSANYGGDTQVLRVTLKNNSSAPIMLRNKTEYTFHNSSDVVTIGPLASEEIEVKTLARKESIALEFEVLNGITAPNTHPSIEIVVTPETDN